MFGNVRHFVGLVGGRKYKINQASVPWAAISASARLPKSRQMTFISPPRRAADPCVRFATDAEEDQGRGRLRRRCDAMRCAACAVTCEVRRRPTRPFPAPGFDPRPREGATALARGCPPPIKSFDPRPREGATNLDGFRFILEAFRSAPPRGGDRAHRNKLPRLGKSMGLREPRRGGVARWARICGAGAKPGEFQRLTGCAIRRWPARPLPVRASGGGPGAGRRERGGGSAPTCATRRSSADEARRHRRLEEGARLLRRCVRTRRGRRARPVLVSRPSKRTVPTRSAPIRQDNTPGRSRTTPRSGRRSWSRSGWPARENRFPTSGSDQMRQRAGTGRDRILPRFPRDRGLRGSGRRDRRAGSPRGCAGSTRAAGVARLPAASLMVMKPSTRASVAGFRGPDRTTALGARASRETFDAKRTSRRSEDAFYRALLVAINQDPVQCPRLER